MPPGDPALGHSADNQIAGVDIGANAKRVLHDYFYLTSPVIDTTTIEAPTLEFWRWLDSDYLPFMQNSVEAWDGKAWQVLWQSGEAPSVDDTNWTRVTLDLTNVSNVKLQVRFGFKIENDGVYSAGSWNLDDVTIGAYGTCVAPILTKVSGQ